MTLTLRRAELGKGDLVVELFERDFQLHVEFERLRRLRTIQNVAHHARAFVELDDGDGIGWRKTRCGGPMADDIAVELPLAAGLEDADLARGAGWTERTRREIHIGTSIAALQTKFAGLRAVPEMLGLRRRFRSRTRRIGHIASSSLRRVCSPAGFDLDATLY